MRKVSTLLYADDQVILAEDYDNETYMLRKFMKEGYDKWGLDMNMEKIVHGHRYRRKQSTTDTWTIKTTQEYKYVGVVLTCDRRDEMDILQKISKGRAIMRQLHSLLWNNNIIRKLESNYKSP